MNILNDVLLSPEDIRKREFWSICQTEEELYLHIKTFLNIDLPRYCVDELSTSNPLDFIWSIYQTMLTNSGDMRHVVACSRNSMKCNAEGTLVATPTGPIEIQNLKIGDTVYDELGLPIIVIGVWDQGVQECVDLSWGGKVWATCTVEHPWLTQSVSNDFIQEVKKVCEFSTSTRIINIKDTVTEKEPIQITPAGKRHCWDITVDSPTSLYCLQNGLITHNTLASAILHFYAMLHFRRDCCQLAATKAQSQACIKYLDKFLMIPEVEDHADINNKEEKILKNLPSNEFTDKNDCKITVIVATLKGTNSSRSSFLLVDEAELIEPDIMSEAANIADPTMREGYDPISIYLSSRKFANGPLQELINECEDPNREGSRLHKWSLADFMEKCPKSLHQPDKPKIKALIHRDTLEVLWEDAVDQIENKSNFIEILAFHGCKTCGAFVACQSRAVKQKGTSPSLRTAKFVAGRLRDVKDTKKIISQILNWKPESSGLVFPMFSPHLHVKESKEAYKWITRGEPFNPMKLTDEAYAKCLESCDPSDKKLVTPSKRDLYKVMVKNGWKIHWGLDWGYTDPAALTILGYNRKEQRAFVLHSELKTGYSNQDWSEYCVSNYKALSPDLICPDMADAAAPTYFSKYFLPVRDTKPSRIETGVSQIRSLLWNVATQEVNFCILDDRLSVDMVEEFQKWTHERTPTGYNFDKFDKDHWNHTCFVGGSVLTKTGPKEISEILPGEEVLTHTGNFKKVNAVMKRKYAGEILKITPYGREEILCTPDHPFFAVDVKRSHHTENGIKLSGQHRIVGELKQVFAADLKASLKNEVHQHHLITPIPKTETNRWFNTLDFLPDHKIDETGKVRPKNESAFANSKCRYYPEIFSCDPTLAFCLGHYAAEGCHSQNRIIIVCHKNEGVTVGPIWERLSNQLGGSFSNKTKDNTCRIEIGSSLLYALFDEMKSHEDKRLPSYCLNLSEENSLFMIAGVLFGDGCFTDGSLRFNVISKSLAYQVFFLLVRLGYRPLIKFISRKNRWKGIRGLIKNDQYGVHLDSTDTKNLLNSFFEHPILKEIYSTKRYKILDSQMQSSKGQKIDKYVTTKIHPIEKINFDGYVYNLEINEDHSYVINGILCENCDSLRYALDPFVSEADIHFAATQSKENSISDLYEKARDPANLTAQIELAKKQMSDHFLKEHGIADLTPHFKIPFAIPAGQALPSFLMNQQAAETEKENKRRGGIFFRFG